MGHKDHFHSCVLTKYGNKLNLFVWTIQYFENTLHSDVPDRVIPFAGMGRQHDKNWVFHRSDTAWLSREDPGVRLQGKEKAGVRISIDCPKFTSLQQGPCQPPQPTALRCLNWTAVIQMKIRASLPKKAGVSSVWADQLLWCKAQYKTPPRLGTASASLAQTIHYKTNSPGTVINTVPGVFKCDCTLYHNFNVKNWIETPGRTNFPSPVNLQLL